MARRRGVNRYRHDPARKSAEHRQELVVAASGNGHSTAADTAIALADSTSPIVVPMTNKRNPGSSPFVSAAGFSALDNGDKPFPKMEPNNPNRPPLEAAGSAGNQIFAGIIAQDAEYNPDFYWRDAIDTFERMRRNDAQINAVLQMLYLPIERTTWRIKPASTSAIDKEIASFVESCLFHDMLYETTEGRTVRQQWMSILEHILLMLPFGFSIFSKWFRVDDQGWVKWARFEPLLQRTLWRWWVGADSQLVGIQQRTFKNWRVEFEDIHADRILRFAWRQEGNNYDGWSVLRSAYKHWYYKDGFYKIQAIAVERSATMPPIGTLGPNDLNQASANALLTQLQNMRVSDSMGIVLPFGQSIQIPENHMRGSQEIDQAIAHHDMMIARNVLAQFLNLGSTETGAYALADVQTKTFMECEEGVCEYIADVLNTDAIPELVDYNYDNVSIYPQIEFEPLADSDVKDVSLAIQNMASFISPDPGFEDYVRKLVGAPSAPKDAVVATNPTAPDKNAKQPGSQAKETQPGKPGIPENPADEVGDGKTQAGNATAAGLREISMDFEYTIALMEADLAEAYDEFAEFLSERDEDTILLYNPNHDAKGRFAAGGDHAGSTPGQVRRSMQHETGIAKAEKALEDKKAAYAAHLAQHPGAALTAEEKAQARAGTTQAPAGTSTRAQAAKQAAVDNSLTPFTSHTANFSGTDNPADVWSRFGSSREGVLSGLRHQPTGSLEEFANRTMRQAGISMRMPRRVQNQDIWRGRLATSISDALDSHFSGTRRHAEQIETRLLNEALAAIYGRDATERGLQHMMRLADVPTCDCSPETPASECTCDAGCACRAGGGSCPSSDAHALSMQFETDIALMEQELAETRVAYHVALREEADAIKLMNANHDSRGRFTYGASGQQTTRGALTKSKGYEASIAKQEAKLQAAKDAYAAHVAATGAELTAEEKAAARSGGSASSSRSTTATSKSQGRLTPIRTVQMDRFDYQHTPQGYPTGHFLKAMYGQNQIAAALSKFGMIGMRTIGADLGVRGGRTKDSWIQAIAGHMAGVSDDAAYARAITRGGAILLPK